MKKFIVITALLVGVIFTAAAQDADAIIVSSRNRIKADTVSTQTKMVITAKNGKTTERMINQYSKDGPTGSRTIVEFLSPASIKGTRYLTMENSSGTSDQWIFLPELNKVRRISASEGGSSFMGTDMSYDDISSADRDTDKDTHTFLREEKYNNKNCYVIQSMPKDKSYQYTKMLSWIDKENFVNYKLELFDKKDKLIKVYETTELKDVGGRLSPWVSRMSNVQKETSTTIYIQKLEYDSVIPDGAFTTAYLETGRTG